MRGPSSSLSNDSGSSTKTGSSGSGSSFGSSTGGRKTESGGGPAGAGKRVIKDSDKSSGTNNLIGSGVGSTLTGKNPFAILKASAIAST